MNFINIDHQKKDGEINQNYYNNNSNMNQNLAPPSKWIIQILSKQ